MITVDEIWINKCTVELITHSLLQIFYNNSNALTVFPEREEHIYPTALFPGLALINVLKNY